MQIQAFAHKISAALAVAVSSIFFAPPASAADGKWLRAESEHFIAYGEITEPELRDSIRELETLDAVLRWLTSVGPGGEGSKLEFYFVKSQSAIRIVNPEADKNTAGIYTSAADVTAAIGMARDGGYMRGQSQQVLFHEYAHYFMFRHFPGGYPAWYVEGFAEYISSISFTGNRVEIGKPPFNAAALIDSSWLPFDKLFSAKMSEIASGARGNFYSQAWAAVHFMFGDAKRQAQVTQYLKLLQENPDSKTAFETAFGATYTEMGDQLKRYVKRGIPYVAVDASRFKVSSNVIVTRLPRGADNLLLPMVRIRLRGPEPKSLVADNEERLRDRKAVYDQMRALTVALPGDPFAERLQAYAEVFVGEPPQAKPLLDAALAKNPNDVEALYLMGVMYLMQAEEGGDKEAKNLTDGRAYFGRLFKITDSNVPMLYRYARSFPALSENTLNVLMRAQMLAPQSTEIGLNTASALIAMKRYDEATAILRPFAASPHGDGGAARQMLDEIGRRVPQPPPSTMTKP